MFLKIPKQKGKLEMIQPGAPCCMPLTSDNAKSMPFVIAGDEAFALSKYVLRPRPNGNSTTNSQLQINKSLSNCWNVHLVLW
jgi:hypothetical protein